MNVLAASSLELGTHPATALLLGGLIAAVIRGRYASMTLVIAPILGFWYVSTLEVGSVSYLSLFGYEILGVAVDQQAKLFGYLFHIAALVAGIYSFHLRDPWQISMALLYAASAVGVAFAGDMLSISLVGRIGNHFSLSNLGRKTKEAEDSGFVFIFSCILRFAPFGRYFDSVSWRGSFSFSLQPLTDALEARRRGHAGIACNWNQSGLPRFAHLA